MRIKSRILTLLIVLLSITQIAAMPSPGWAWSVEGHQIVAAFASKLLPAPWRQFFAYYGWLLNETTAYPDTYYRGTDPNEGPRHFVDLEVWNSNSPWTGTLPQSIREFAEKMQSAMQQKDWNSMFLYAGRVAHYLADATQPYHTTINYNPNTRNGVGLHAVLDASLAAHVSEFRIVNSAEVPLSPIGNLTSYALSIAIQSHTFLPIINRTLIDEGLDWSPELTRIIENRTNTAIIAVARVWYTAILSAHIEAPILPSVNQLSIGIESINLTSKSSVVRFHVTDALGVRTYADVKMVLNNSTIHAFVANVFPPVGEYIIVLGPGTAVANFRLSATRSGYNATTLAVNIPQSTSTQISSVSTYSSTTVESTKLSTPTITTTIALVVMAIALVALILVRRGSRDS